MPPHHGFRQPPRIPEEHFENPDGSSLSIDKDLTGSKRPAKFIAGPLAYLQPGKNKIRLFESAV